MFPHRVNDSIILKILEAEDAPDLFALVEANRRHLREWMGWVDETTELQHSRDFIASASQAFTDSGVFACGIWHHSLLCGVIAYNFIHWESRIGYPGYWLAENHQGRGIVTESMRALIHHAFYIYKLDQLVIHAATGNYKSQAIADRLGFRRDGVKPNAEWLYDHYVDHSVHRLDRPQD